MLVPIVGLFLACILFACIGAVVLAVLPKLRVNVRNVLSFVVGAVPACAGSAVVYGRLVGDAAGTLTAPAVLGLYAVLLLGGMFGGILTLWIAHRILGVAARNESPSRSPANY